MNTLDQPSVTFRPATFLSGAPGPWAGHLPFACDLIAALRPEVIVELGVFYGDSYFGFCQTVAETNLPCTCYGVDTWRGDTPASFYESSVYDAVSRHNDRYYRAFSYLMRTSFAKIGNFTIFLILKRQIHLMYDSICNCELMDKLFGPRVNYCLK